MGRYLNQILSESGVTVIRSFGRGDYFKREFFDISNGLSRIEIDGALTGRWQISLINFLFACSPALTYWYAGFINANGVGSISIGTIVAATGLQYALFGPFIGMLRISIEINGSMSVLERVISSLNVGESHIFPQSKGRKDQGKGFVMAEDICFSYKKSEI